MGGHKSPQCPRIMLTGANGQVGWELNRSLLPLGDIVALTRKECDLSRPENLPSIVQEIKPDVIINAAAYTTVDKAEEEEALAMTINGTSVGVLAEEAKKCNALLIHYSTDYVFDGTKPSPYTEEDIPNPINVYGRSKLAGEEAMRQVGGRHLIFRTSWVYASRGNNFLKTIRRLVQKRDELSIVDDQIGTPTWARLIAQTTSYCTRQSICEIYYREFLSDTYNLTMRGETSWYDFAKRIVELICHNQKNGRYGCDIKSIKSINYPTPAIRPKNSRIAINKIEKKFQLKMPEWEKALALCIEESYG